MISISNAKQLIEYKILRNECFIELLKTCNQIADKEISLRQESLMLNKQKIICLETINRIENEQLSHYTLERQESVLDITKDINELMIDTDYYEKEFIQLKEKRNKLMDYINKIDNIIPRNVKLVPKKKIQPIENTLNFSNFDN